MILEIGSERFESDQGGFPAHTITIPAAPPNRGNTEPPAVIRFMNIQSGVRLPMDLQPTIRILQLELERIEAAIAELERLQNAKSGNPSHKSNRGRKSMDSEERQQVSERMKKYWASRRNAS
jgi:hypothetical protein